MGLATRVMKDIQNDFFGLNCKRIEISIDEIEGKGYVHYKSWQEGNLCMSYRYRISTKYDQRKIQNDSTQMDKQHPCRQGRR